MNIDDLNLTKIGKEELFLIEGGGFWREVGWWAGATAKAMYNGVVEFGENMAEGFGRVF